MESNLLFYLWKNKLATGPTTGQLLISNNGTPNIRRNMTAFKTIKHMLNNIKPMQSNPIPYNLPEKKPILDFMWYSPKELNTMTKESKLWCISNNAKEYLLDQNVQIYQQLKAHGWLTRVQGHPDKYNLKICNTTIKEKHAAPRVFLGDESDIEDDMILSDVEPCDDIDDENICFTVTPLKPLCIDENPKVDYVAKDNLVDNVVNKIDTIPAYFGNAQTPNMVYFPYFETFEDREEASALLHYYKSKAVELGINAMEPGQSFIVDKELDEFYDTLYNMASLKTTVTQAIEQLNNVVAEETYNAWDLWEESMETVKTALHTAFTNRLKGKTEAQMAKLKEKTEAERAYKVKWIEEVYVAWLSTYKHNHYVPYKFLIKYFK